MTIFYQYYPSPVGNLLLLAKENGLIAIEFDEEQPTTKLEIFIPESNTNGTIYEIFRKTR